MKVDPIEIQYVQSTAVDFNFNFRYLSSHQIRQQIPHAMHTWKIICEMHFLVSWFYREDERNNMVSSNRSGGEVIMVT